MMDINWDNIRKKIDEALEDKVFPGGVLQVLHKGKSLFKESFGVRDYIDYKAVTLSTVYDLASLTKPLATTLAMMNLCGNKVIDIDKHLSFYIKEVVGEKKNISISQLLSHSSGLPAHREYYKKLLEKDPDSRKEYLRNLLIEEELIAAPGAKILYSDLGFMFLEWIVEVVAGKSIDKYVAELYSAINIETLFYTGFCPNKDYEYAPTEECNYRGLLKGFVHDDNCYATNGICGHAGLFGDVDSVASLIKEIVLSYRGESSFLDKSVVRRFLKRQSPFEKPLGFDSPNEVGASCGDLFSKNSIGHLGFTGTSFWVDLERDIIVILLTNRVHPTRENIKIRKFRPLIHNMIMAVIPDKTLNNR